LESFAPLIPMRQSRSLRAASMRLTRLSGESEAMLRCANVFPQQDALLRLNTTGELLLPA
jgi:hypothetical protein